MGVYIVLLYIIIQVCQVQLHFFFFDEY